MARRPGARQAPPSTRAALLRCIEDALPWAEVDVRLTRDGPHVLSQDSAIEHTDGRRVEIRDQSWETLRTLDVGSHFAERFTGERLLSLPECLALCKGKLNLLLNCREANPEQLAREVLAAAMERQVMVSADTGTLQRLRHASGGRLALLAEWHPESGSAAWASSNGLAAVEMDARNLTRRMQQQFSRAGIQVVARFEPAADRPNGWDRAMKAGADLLLTEFPEELLAYAIRKRLPRRSVQISFHRGASLYAPENTLAAFEKAIRMRADFVEFDVRATRDGVFMLLHDSRLDRTTDGRGPLAQITAATASRLSAGAKFGRPFAAEPVPTLEEFLSAFAGRTEFYLDAKAIPPDALAAVLARRQLAKQTVIYQSPDYLTKLKRLCPASRVLAPLQSPVDLEKLATLKPYAVDADWSVLSQDLIARCHAAGIKVFSDALGEHERIEDYQQAIAWGIDVIQTDHPLRVLRALELLQHAPAAN